MADQESDILECSGLVFETVSRLVCVEWCYLTGQRACDKVAGSLH